MHGFCCFRYNRTKIRWTRNRKTLEETKTIKISKKGALRVLNVTYRDAGVYACHAGNSMAELKLKIKPKPGDPDPTDEDYESSEEEIIEGQEGKCWNRKFLLETF